MRKKWLTALLAPALLFTAFSPASAANVVKSDMSITLNGQAASFAQSGYLIDDSLFVPFRAIAESLGGTVGWDGEKREASLKKGDNTVVFGIDAGHAVVNGVSVMIDKPARIIDDMTYVPVRFLAETLGLTVGYDDATRSVSLVSSAKPSFQVKGVSEGGIVYSDQLKVSVVAVNHALKDFRTNTQAKPGEGHIHLWLDTDASDPKAAVKSFTGEPVVFDKLAPGDHTLTVQLVNNDHSPIQPEVKQVIKFKSAKAPGLEVTGPKEGETIRGTTVTVSTKVTDLNLVDFRSNPKAAVGEGHVHIWLDSDTSDAKAAYKQINSDPVTFENVLPGEHTLTVQLVGSDHKPLQPEVKKVIRFKTEPVKTYNVEMSQFKFNPAEITIEAGSTITFTNKDKVRHDVVAVDGSFKAPLLNPGESYTLAFSKPGEYEIYCTPHKNFMKGKIIVK